MPEQKPLILAVDDDLVLLKVVKRTLEIEGYRVITASDGKEALRLIEEQEPSLVLLDIMMPGLNGFEVCERIRDFSRIPIIMLTAKTKTEDVVHGLDVGADDYLTKPFGTGELIARIKRLLHHPKNPRAEA